MGDKKDHTEPSIGNTVDGQGRSFATVTLHVESKNTTETENLISTVGESTTDTATFSKDPFDQPSDSGGSKVNQRQYESFVIPFDCSARRPIRRRHSGNISDDAIFRHPTAVPKNTQCTAMANSQSNGRKDTPIPTRSSAIPVCSLRPRRIDSSETFVPSFYDRDEDERIVIESFGSASFSAANTIMPSFLTSGAYCERKITKRLTGDTSPTSEPVSQQIRGNRLPAKSESYEIDDFYLAPSPDSPIQQSVRELSSAHSTQATCASRWSSRQREREVSSDDEEYNWNSDSGESYYTTASCTSVGNLSNSYSLTFDDDFSPGDSHSAITGPLGQSLSTITGPLDQSQSSITDPLDESESTITDPLDESRSTATGPLNQSQSTVTGPLNQSQPTVTGAIKQKLSNNTDPGVCKEHFLPPINISFPYVINASAPQQLRVPTKEKIDFEPLPVIRQAHTSGKVQGRVCLQSTALWENGTLKVTVQSPEPKRLNPEQKKALRSIQAIDGLVRPDVTLTIVHQSTRPPRPAKSIKSSKGTRNRQKSKCTRKKKEMEADAQPAADRDVIERRAALPPFDTSLDLDSNQRRQN